MPVDVAASRILALFDDACYPWLYRDYGAAFLVVTYDPGTG